MSLSTLIGFGMGAFVAFLAGHGRFDVAALVLIFFCLGGVSAIAFVDSEERADR